MRGIITILVCGFSLTFLAGCQPSSYGYAGGNNNTSGLGTGGVNSTFGSAPSTLANALGSIPAANSDQQQAIAQAQSGLGNVGNAAEVLLAALAAGNSSQVSPALENYLQTLQALEPFISALQRNNLDQVAQALQELSITVPVIRMFNASTQKHIFTTNPQEVVTDQQSYGFAPEQEIPFEVYTQPLNATCNVLLARCYAPAQDNHWVNNSADCQGGNPDGNPPQLGYGCNAPTTSAPLALYRMSNPTIGGGGDHVEAVATSSDISTFQSQGYTIDGGGYVLAYPPIQ